ncbi:uncharacterized protein LOC141637464 [Silene latifolia]|uniref:uncharacterized protein LOC141637464 n=1 Tax=Silene latifolia TaxID=37657 RepID=UPI003D76B9B2
MELLSRKLRHLCSTPNVSFHPKCVKLGLTRLVFVDDLMIFLRGDLPTVSKATTELAHFSTWSGLTANLDKTEIYFGGVSEEVKQLILQATSLQEGVFPFRNLGIPIHASRLHADMYGALILKLQQLFISCPSQYLSYAGRVQVLNSVLFGLGNF